jgi:beta-glucanase (GH16 family)
MAGSSRPPRGRWRRWPLGILVLVCGVLVLATCGSLAGHPEDRASTSPSEDARTFPRTAAVWGKPIYTETFDEKSLDPAKWFVYDTPTAATFPRSKDSVRVADGELQIVGGFDKAGADVSGGLANGVNQLYGRWEARFRIDQGAGYSAVVLLWPQSEKWPQDGEIDAIQVSDGTRANAQIFVHNGFPDHKLQYTVQADFTKWHTVAVDWLPDRLTFWLDNHVVQTVSRAAGLGASIPATSLMHLALQNDKGCVDDIPCRNSATPSKVIMDVDWVRIFRAPAALLGQN